MISGLTTTCIFISAAIVGDHSLPFFQPVTPPRPIQTIALGGMSRQAPSHSRPALERAVIDGVEWVAFFVRRTVDGKHLIISEDAQASWENLTGKSIRESRYAEIHQFPFASSFHSRFASERIMSMEEALQAAKERINLFLFAADVDPESFTRSIQDSGMTNQVIIGLDHPKLPLPEVDRNELLSLSEGKLAICSYEKKLITLKDERFAIGIVSGQNAEDFDKEINARTAVILTDAPEIVIARQTVKRLNDRKVNRPKISHHRGAGRYAPENTLPALEETKLLQADFIEFDIRPSSDGVYFVLHDSKLDRTSNGKGPINQMTAAEIKSLDAGSWFGKPFEGTRIPTLDEFLAQVGEKIELYVDAKDIPPEKLVEALRKRGLIERSVVYEGDEYLRRLRELEPKLRRMPPLDDPRDIETLVEKVAPYAFDTSWKLLSKDTIDRCHQHGVLVFSDALGLYERSTEYQKGARIGVDLIQTDQPLRVLRAFELLPVSH
ncbi:glycerophosphodiester phosphodiesterase family protein [bacterium]|nr:glycerophosphodiester phosphodiesterase family protein [bacterium]